MVGFLNGGLVCLVGFVTGDVSWVARNSGMSSAVRSIVVDFDLDRGREEEASAFFSGEAGWAVSIVSKAALARPKGVVTLSDGLVDSSLTSLVSFDSAAFSSCAVALVNGTFSFGVGVGDGVTADSDLFLPPPKKLFRVCCLPLNSSRNLVANRGGSGAVLGGSVG